MTPEQIADTLNAATQSLEAVNQNMNAFMLTMVGVVVVGALLIMFVFIRTTDKISDRTASTQKQDNDIQIKTLDLAGNLIGSVNRLSTTIEGDVEGRKKLTAALEDQVSTTKSFIRESGDRVNALSETVAHLSTKVQKNTDVVQEVHASMKALEETVRDLCSDETAAKRCTDKIEQVKNEILAAIQRRATTEAAT